MTTSELPFCYVLGNAQFPQGKEAGGALWPMRQTNLTESDSVMEFIKRFLTKKFLITARKQGLENVRTGNKHLLV